MTDKERTLRYISHLPQELRHKELEYEEQYGFALDNEYEEKFLKEWGNDEDYLNIKRLEKELDDAEQNDDNESAAEILQKTATLMELTLKFNKKVKEKRQKRYIKIS
jgi:hypothetical protein